LYLKDQSFKYNTNLKNQIEMAVMKVIEVMANSEESWEQAVKNAVKTAAKSVKNIRSVYVKDQTANVSGDNITDYRVIVKITFEVEA
jgi:dodecin